MKKGITIKDVAFLVGLGATIIWACASLYSIKANKARLELIKKDEK